MSTETLASGMYAEELRERLLSGPIVDIYVGADKRLWSLHRNLLSYHSEFLRAELQHAAQSVEENGTSKSSHGTLRLDLPDEAPEGFELLVKWLYQGKLDDVSSISDDTEKYQYAVACQKLHLLCDRFDLPKLKNIAMDQYRKGLHAAGLVPDASELNDIYRRSPESSPFRRLMVKIAARQLMDPEGDKEADSYRQCFEENPDFVVDLINAIKWGSGGILFEDPTEGQNCDYHDHDSGPNCHDRNKKKLDIRPGSRSPPPSPTPRSGRQSPSQPAQVNGLAESSGKLHNGGARSPSSHGDNERRDGSSYATPGSPKHATSPPSSVASTPTRPSTARKSKPPKLRRRKSVDDSGDVAQDGGPVVGPSGE
ncbi:hypothetical protein EJ06DRAFT_581067 [Trichodelitschia bisporula]|uniref:BTB domain-containing protein n=1 Tax=Trichodelitschia bisporula TaxID=703511 RepID=A0A6G1I1H7_9PEZI|nr:hypothetical protein EJ06DRAFT_581067 [Trichodelitschia bisporula]